MRITSAAVNGLFGLFNHELPLNHPERITIVHGPNGIGKTVMLRMIEAVANTKIQFLRETPFDEFRLTLDDGSARIVRRHDSDPTLLRFISRDENGVSSEPRSSVILAQDLPAPVLAEVDRLIPSPFSLVGDLWVDQETDEIFSLSEILERFPDATEAIPPKYRFGSFFEVFQTLDVFFVEANRLGAQEPNEPEVRPNLPRRIRQPIRHRVKQYAEDVGKRIQAVLANYAKNSQESDRTFPERLVRFVREGQNALSEREILDRMAELEKKRQRLISLGLLDSETGLHDLSEEDVRRAREALTIYVGDVQEKLAAFDDMAQRIGSLMDIVNDRFKYKRLTIERGIGFRVVSDLSTTVELEDLSSGEQHELVVLYELLFRTPPRGVILIDEPEISLHVAWQSRFLSDLLEILKLTDAYAIVATHSPVIIGNRWDLTVELNGPSASS